MLKELKMQQKAIKAPEKKTQGKNRNYLTFDLLHYNSLSGIEQYFLHLVYFFQHRSCIVYMLWFKFFLYSKFFKPVQIFQTG